MTLVIGKCSRERLTQHLVTCTVPFNINYDDLKSLQINLQISLDCNGHSTTRVYVCTRHPEYTTRAKGNRQLDRLSVVEFQLAVNFAMALADQSYPRLRFPRQVIATTETSKSERRVAEINPIQSQSTPLTTIGDSQQSQTAQAQQTITSHRPTHDIDRSDIEFRY